MFMWNVCERQEVGSTRKVKNHGPFKKLWISNGNSQCNG